MNNGSTIKMRPVAHHLSRLVAVGLCISWTCLAAGQTPTGTAAKAPPGRSKAAREGAKGARRSGVAPTLVNVAYGPDASNKIDFWKADCAAPTPLVVLIHGGGFRGGDKAAYDAPLLTACLASGISYASINYRLSGTAPYPA